MSKEIQVAHVRTGKTLYALIRNATGSVWQTTTNTFVSYATANLANYDVALTEEGTASRYYAGDFPTNINTAGVYSVAVFEQAGGSPAEGDTLVAVGDLHWNGTAVVARGTLNTGSITADAIATDAIDADALAADAVAEITTDLATADGLDDLFSAIASTIASEVVARLPNALVGGRIDASVGAMASGVLTAAAVATGAIDADALATDAAQKIADALLDRTAGVETGYTVRQALRIILSALAGKLQGAGTTTVQIRDVNDSKDRISATVDSSGNRSAVTLDAS